MPHYHIWEHLQAVLNLIMLAYYHLYLVLKDDIIYFTLDWNVKNWLDKESHVQTVYNAIDFCYRQSLSVGKKICWEIQDGGQGPRYYGIFWRPGHVLNVWETEMTIDFAFTREGSNKEVTSIFSLILTMAERHAILDFHSVVYDVVSASRNMSISGFHCISLHKRRNVINN